MAILGTMSEVSVGSSFEYGQCLLHLETGICNQGFWWVLSPDPGVILAWVPYTK